MGMRVSPPEDPSNETDERCDDKEPGEHPGNRMNSLRYVACVMGEITS